MAKTSIKEPFGKWRVLNSGVLIRESGHAWVNVHMHDFQVWSGTGHQSKTASGFVGTASSAMQALGMADAYVSNNFEVEKSTPERLADAEAEIVTLKGRVKELEEVGKPGFIVGQLVRVKANLGKRPYPVRQIESFTSQGKIFVHGLHFPYSADELEPA